MVLMLTLLLRAPCLHVTAAACEVLVKRTCLMPTLGKEKTFMRWQMLRGPDLSTRAQERAWQNVRHRPSTSAHSSKAAVSLHNPFRNPLRPSVLVFPIHSSLLPTCLASLLSSGSSCYTAPPFSWPASCSLFWPPLPTPSGSCTG